MAGSQIQRRRGTTAEHSTFTGAVGETTIDTTKKTVVVHDGTTPGGFPLAREAANTFTGIQRWAKGADVASANALALGTDGNYFDITGTTSITSIGTLGVGTHVKLHFDAALTLTHHATDLILPGGANITTTAGDEAEFVEYATGDWRCTSYTKANGKAVAESVTEGAWTDYSASTTVAGFSSTSTKQVWYRDIGKTRFVFFNIAGTSNATNFTFTLPSASAGTGPAVYFPLGLTANNGGYAASGSGSLAAGASEVVLYTTLTGTWTASSTKQAAGQFFYQLP